MPHALQIPNARERWMVRLADLATAPLAWRRPRQASGAVARVLLLRLERIGDLVMTRDAIADAREAWPGAEIDVAVGTWNAPIAALLAGVTRVEILTVPWLARDGQADAWPSLVAKARAWRARRYDVVVNFEPDVRSNFLAWLSGAPRRVGYGTGGGGAFLTDAADYTPTDHVSVNACRLVARAAGRPDGPAPAARTTRLVLPDDAVRRARALVGGASRPRIGIHASGGRASKQWHLDRFAAAARAIVRARGGTIVLTGTDADRPLVDAVRAGLADDPTIDAAGALDLPSLAALLAELDVLVTGDTGPMHLAAAVDTPVVALFGPSDPARYGPRARAERILRVDLPCSPCGLVRLPPERCRGHVPECLDRIGVDEVAAAAIALLDEVRQESRS
jgi:ADP-heptose:LPS heptosyltransferase